ncbi:hypothetical protein CR513_50514, partial [Mucuna pruriens]
MAFRFRLGSKDILRSFRPKVHSLKGVFHCPKATSIHRSQCPNASTKWVVQRTPSSKYFMEPSGGFKVTLSPSSKQSIQKREVRPKALRASIRRHVFKPLYKALLLITSYLKEYTQMSKLREDNTNKVDLALDAPCPLRRNELKRVIIPVVIREFPELVEKAKVVKHLE